MLIKNAMIATSKGVFNGDVLTGKGIIKAVGEGLSALAGSEKTIDATGKYLLPGAVDVHTHMDLDVGFTRASDDFYTGTVAAACGGTTTIVDHMAFGPKGCKLSHQADIYAGLAKDAVIDYGLHGTIQHVDDSILEEMDELSARGITSFKFYLTYDFSLGDSDVLKVLDRAAKRGYMICVHCENDAAIGYLKQAYLDSGMKTPRYHALSRPNECEAEAIYRMLALSKLAGEAPLYVVHLSTELGLDAIRAARAHGQRNVFAETCPQYLLLDDSRYEDTAEGLKFIMSPPLRKPGDSEALWQGLKSGDIDAVATDHCPFFFETQKQRGKDDFSMCPNGAPGVEARLPLMFSHGFMDGRLTLPEVVQLCCSRPAQLFGLGERKGDIRVGMDADFVLIDPEKRFSFSKSHLHEHVDYTPYEGLEQQGYPILTISRGEIIAKEGAFLGGKGRGQYLKRAKSQLD